MIVSHKSGKALPKSGAGGKRPMMLMADFNVRLDLRERQRYGRSGYLPHQGVRESARSRTRQTCIQEQSEAPSDAGVCLRHPATAGSRFRV